MDFFEQYRKAANDRIVDSTCLYELCGHPGSGLSIEATLDLASSVREATIVALKDIVASHEFWEWITFEYDSMEWADDVNLKAVQKGRVYAIQMLGLIVRLLTVKDESVA